MGMRVSLLANGQCTMTARILEARAPIEAVHHNGSTALILAAAEGHEEMVARLFEGKVSMEAVNKNGDTF